MPADSFGGKVSRRAGTDYDICISIPHGNALSSPFFVSNPVSGVSYVVNGKRIPPAGKISTSPVLSS
jgi:hypothetical protein